MSLGRLEGLKKGSTSIWMEGYVPKVFDYCLIHGDTHSVLLSFAVDIKCNEFSRLRPGTAYGLHYESCL